MIEAPLIFRVAGWPIETIGGLQSLEITQQADRWIGAEESIRTEAESLSEALYPVVPLLLHKRDRARLLAVRRALHRSAAPLLPELLQSVLDMQEAPELLRTKLCRHAMHRSELERERREMATFYESALVSEYLELREIVQTPEFRKALCLASPATFRELDDAHDHTRWRMTRTLLRFALRAAGRATPNGLWAGVGTETDEPAFAVCFQPCLLPFAEAVSAIASKLPWFETIPLYVNPSLTRTHEGGWRFEAPKDQHWTTFTLEPNAIVSGLVEESRSPLLPGEWRSAVACDETEWVERLARYGVLLSTLSFPDLYGSAWEALRECAQRVPEPERAHWSAALDALECICNGLQQRFHELTPDEFDRELAHARSLVNALLSRYGCAPVTADEHVLVADSRAPFRFQLPADLKVRIGTAVRATWQFDRLGIGECDAASRRNSEFGAGPLTLRDAVSLSGSSMGELQTPDLLAGWEQELSRDFQARTRRLSREPEEGFPPPFLPPGSCLLRLARDGESWTIRIGSVTPDPALFYARFDRLLDAPFREWYRQALDGIERRNPGLRFADLAIRSPSDLNAAARPRFRPIALDAFNAAEGCISRASNGLPRLQLHERGQALVPLVHSAVSLHTSDAYTRKLAALMHLMGRPSLTCPLPPLPRERTEWHRLPRLELRDEVVIGAERWTMPAERLKEFSAAAGLDRYIAWRKWVHQAKLPDLVYVFTGMENTESLLPSTSVLAVEALGRSIGDKAVELRFQEAYPDPRESWLTDEQGRHYLVEIAAAWQGDEGFWSAYNKSEAA